MKGLITAQITPFKNQEIDFLNLRELIEKQIPHVDGILICGTTQETPTLSDAEKKRCIELSHQLCKNKIHLMVGVGTNDTKTTLKNMQLAKELGADSALVVTPYYNRPTQEGIFEHLKILNDTNILPICLYNIPKRTGVSLSIETLEKLDSLSNIKALKESSQDIDFFLQCKERLQLDLLCGDDLMALPSYTAGAQGLISTSSNLIPKKIREFVESCKKQQGLGSYLELAALFRAINTYPNPIGLKYAMSLKELCANELRLPLCPIKNDTTIKNILKTYD